MATEVRTPETAGTTAATALRLAADDPRRARELATPVVALAARSQDWSTVSTARRALGVAALHLRDVSTAVRQLRAAVRAGIRAGAPELVGAARMSLASALLLRGASGPAFTEIDLSVSELRGAARARALVQRSALWQEMGRWEEALADTRAALPVLRRVDDGEWLVRALSNRSLLFIDRRAFANAENDLAAALELCRRHGLHLPAAYARQNRGCLLAHRGDLPGALAEFAEAERLYRALGVSVGTLATDRAELLVSARLLGEAREAAQEAVAEHTAAASEVHLPEARLLLASVAALQGDHDVANACAAAAQDTFERQGRRAWGALAAHVGRLAAAEAGAPVSAAVWRRTAAELAAAGWASQATEAAVRAGESALRAGDLTGARRDLASAGPVRRTGTASQRANAWHAEALLRLADGKPRAARAAVSAGLRVVEEHRAGLGATELRAHAAGHRGDLVRLGVRLAVQTGRPRTVFAAVERAHAGGNLQPSLQPRDALLADLLSDLRATVAELDGMRAAGRSDPDLAARQKRLEREVADRSRVLPGVVTTPARPVGVPEVLAVLGPDEAFVEFFDLDGELRSLVLAGGRITSCSHGPLDQVRGLVARTGFGLRRAAAGGAAAAGGRRLLASVGERLEEVLGDPLRRAVGDRELVVVPSSVLRPLAWGLLPGNRGRPVSVVGSATRWCEARARVVPSRDVVVVAGPGLAGAVEEARIVAAEHPGAQVLSGAQATAAAVRSTFHGSALLHVAAHGRLRADNPMFSALELSDGPFTLHDVDSLASAPAHVVLAACETGRSVELAGEEALGFADALLARGTKAVTAPVVPVDDLATVGLSRDLHRGIAAGRSASRALADAQELLDRDDPRAVGGLGFVCLGDGGLRLVTT